MKDGACLCVFNIVRNGVCVSETMCTATHTVVSLCVFLALEMYRAAGRVPQAIKSIFQELQRCCRLLPAALKTSTRGEGWEGGGEGLRVVVGEEE